MTTRTRLQLALALAVAVTGCKKKEDTGNAPKAAEGTAPGSAMAPGSAAMTQGSAAATPTAPPKAAPLVGKDLAMKYMDCGKMLNSGKLDDFKANCLAADFVNHMEGMPEVKGADAMAAHMQMMRTAFPDFKAEPALVLISGRNIFSIGMMTGTNSGPMKMGEHEMPATNKKTGSLMFHKLAINDENKATEEWAFHDGRTLMGQLGVLPKEAGPTRPVLDKVPAFPEQIVVAADDAKEKANVEAYKKMLDAINAHKSADAAAMYADNSVESDQADDKDHTGKKELQKGLDDFIKTFPDVKLDVPAPVGVGDYVVAIGTMTGTNKGPMGKMKPTNKSVSGNYAEVVAFKDGKITNTWRFRNGADMAKQLGLMPDHAGKDAGGAGGKDAPKGDEAGKKK